MPEITITRFVKADGPLTKRIYLAGDGALVSDGSACVMAAGTAYRRKVSDVGDLGALIEQMPASEALALGALRPGLPDKVRIVTKNKANGSDAIARTAGNLIYRPGPAAALFDFDTKAMPDTVAAAIEERGGFWPALVAVIPHLASAAHVSRCSTSAGLFRADTGEKLNGSNGLHVYVMVQNGSDIERFLTSLHERCWLAGLGWMMVGAGGQLLERSIVDRMVGAPERLVFEGAPVLEPPLRQVLSWLIQVLTRT